MGAFCSMVDGNTDEIYAPDLIYDRLLRLRLQGYMSALSVMAHAGGARSSFRGRNLCSSSEPSKGGLEEKQREVP